MLRGNLLANRFQTKVYDERGVPTIRMHGWNVPRLRIGGELWVQIALRLLKLYIQKFGRPDLLHAHNVLWSGVAANRASRLLGIPYMITEHSCAYVRGLVRVQDENAVRETLSKAHSLIAVSESLRTAMSRYVAQEKILTIPNVVDTDFFTLPETERKDEPFRFLCVALLTAVKGIDQLLLAFADAFRQKSHVVLEIGGDGPERGRLEELATQLGVRSQVRFLGMLSRRGVREAMWRSNVFVLPSYVETFGVVLIEAIATGLFVIATRSGGPDEIVTSDVGMLVEVGDIPFLSRALRDAYEARYQFRPHEIRALAVKRYGIQKFSSRLLEVYRTALGHDQKKAFSS